MSTQLQKMHWKKHGPTLIETEEIRKELSEDYGLAELMLPLELME